MPQLDLFAQHHKALGDPNRIRIIRLLNEKSLCVCDLESIVNLPQYAVSRHLAILRQAGLVRAWRKGTWMHYRLEEKLPPTFLEALNALCREWDTDKVIKKDLKQLRKHCKEC